MHDVATNEGDSPGEFVEYGNLDCAGLGAINLEQLDVLLESLKSYWDYTNQKSFLAEIKSSVTIDTRTENVPAYEL